MKTNDTINRHQMGYRPPMLDIVPVFPEKLLCGSIVEGSNNTIKYATIDNWDEI